MFIHQTVRRNRSEFKIEEKTFWKFGRQDMFPDAELKVLFQIQDLGQSRANRKDAIVPFKSEEIDKFFE